MFYLAEALLLGKGLFFSSHRAVHGAFGEHFAKTRLLDPRFHRYLIEALEIRTTGDYISGVEISEVEAAQEIARAEEFLAAAKPSWKPHECATRCRTARSLTPQNPSKRRKL